ncbi:MULTISPECIES: helix-turn-helix transcriptional regulator [Clostridium]|uniref:Helix-turn-helix transcriptional regulator n=1 Tax=Clostridium cibarium TaxID=2762247 RepID=A0ABR8PXY6_9CLOT|nr:MULTISPECIES: helix-turn-helix transcriptional regulator [Clostridium]MBD7913032.1 helix-turn-helix transcriptional regulator [Clostridium cibarium]
MEILSTGEKIKRARIYKGITLKDLCEDKISISKMSCIENGKVKADKEIVQFIANKIELDYDYLIQDVYEQIVENLATIKAGKGNSENIEEDIKHNLYYAVEYEYYELAFDLIHILFSYYLEEQKYEKVQLIISQYYDLYQKNNKDENTIVYYNDMAKYLLQNEEYSEAIAYYVRLREIIDIEDSTGKELFSTVAYNEGICYCRLHNDIKAYDLLKESIRYEDYLQGDINKGKVCQAYAMVCIRLGAEDAQKYVKKTYEYQKSNPMIVASAKGEYGKAYFEVGQNDKAVEEILEGIKMFPRHNKEKYVQFLNESIETLYKYKEYDRAYDLAGQALDLAIETGEIKLIEKSYYFKGSILQRKGNFREAEMYMNLALDSLLKFGTKEERRRRYMDMASMYYNLGDVKDSLKYFSLAMTKEKNIL